MTKKDLETYEGGPGMLEDSFEVDHGEITEGAKDKIREMHTKGVFDRKRTRKHLEMKQRGKDKTKKKNRRRRRGAKASKRANRKK